MITLSHVQTEDLHSVWPFVLPGLQKVKKRSSAIWLPEDVYSMLRAQSSLLFIGYDEGEYCGFIVITPLAAWDGKEMHIWAAYSAIHGAVEKFYPEVERVCRALGGKRMSFWSPRKWARKIAPFGMQPKQVQFSKEL